MEVQLKEQIYRYIDNPLDAGTNLIRVYIMKH